ncbi:uncharacterized protein LOC121979816 [Zingiber officinale]|uniref:uncharacterized protein LOC121979816 n=1 Tax=Zingiber officinale TaxID=94328 RepID=UPI001C4D55BD|nr:uncharacterized protein LOC121979816 [Zingiber officinale]
MGEVKGDQLTARWCYVEMVKLEELAAWKIPRLEVNTIMKEPPTLVYEEKEEVQIHPIWDPSPSSLGQRTIVRRTEAQGWCEGYGILQAFTSVAYPQSNGKEEVTNREILRGLRARLNHARGSWVDELPSLLWAHRTTPREATDITLFYLVYEDEAMVLVEVGVESNRVQLYDEGNAKQRLIELNLVDEARDRATIPLMAYRQRMKHNYNRRVIPRLFQVEDLVWKRVKPVCDVTKLETPWGGPYKVIQKLRSGAYYL